MSTFKIGQHYDEAFKSMEQKDVMDNLEGIAYDLSEQSYTKNLTEEELAERKDQYSEIGIKLSEIATKKKEAMERFKAEEKEPAIIAKDLLESIKYKSEQNYGKLYLVDDQEEGMMYFFDTFGVCVDARPLTKQERQQKLKSLKTGSNE